MHMDARISSLLPVLSLLAGCGHPIAYELQTGIALNVCVAVGCEDAGPTSAYLHAQEAALWEAAVTRDDSNPCAGQTSCVQRRWLKRRDSGDSNSRETNKTASFSAVKYSRRNICRLTRARSSGVGHHEAVQLARTHILPSFKASSARYANIDWHLWLFDSMFYSQSHAGPCRR